METGLLSYTIKLFSDLNSSHERVTDGLRRRSCQSSATPDVLHYASVGKGALPAVRKLSR
jgi:hypothetical protein